MPRVTPETEQGKVQQQAQEASQGTEPGAVGQDSPLAPLEARIEALEERLTSPVVEQIEGQVETLVADLFRARFDGRMLEPPRRSDSLSVEIWEGTPTPHGLVRFLGHEVFRCRLPAVTDPEEYVARAFAARLHRLLSSDL